MLRRRGLLGNKAACGKKDQTQTNGKELHDYASPGNLSERNYIHV
jgi:hypothetical protein